MNGKWMLFILLILQPVDCPPIKHGETWDLLTKCDASPKKLPQACEVESFQQSSCPHFTVYHCLLSNSSKLNYPFKEKCLDLMIVDTGKCAVLSEKEMKIIQCKGPDCPTEKYLSLCAFKYEGCKQADIFNRSNNATANSNEKVPSLTTPIKEQESILSSVRRIESILWTVIAIFVVIVVVSICCFRRQIERNFTECWRKLLRRLYSTHLSQGHTEDGRRNQKSQPGCDHGTSPNLTDISPPSHPKNEGHPEVAKDEHENSEMCQSLIQSGCDHGTSPNLTDISPPSHPKNEGHPEVAKDEHENSEMCQSLIQSGCDHGTSPNLTDISPPSHPGSSSAGESKTWENLPSSSQQHVS